MAHDSEPPAPPPFRLSIRAAESDVDGLGHISNIAYVRWIQDVAVAHSTALGYGPAVYQQLGEVFVVRKHEVLYLVPSYAGDALELVTRVTALRGAQCVRETQVIRAHDQVKLATAATQWVYICMATGRPRRIPKDMQQAFFGSSPAAVDAD